MLCVQVKKVLVREEVSYSINNTSNIDILNLLKSHIHLDAVRYVPDDRILSESDVPRVEDVKMGTAGSIAYISTVRGISISQTARLTAENGLRFLKSIGK